ncbi:MAG: beta-L-arabinofuranosidase domain-containing protein [Verrucomicrobiota bacterium]
MKRLLLVCLMASQLGGLHAAEKLTAVPLSQVRLLASDFKERQDLHRKILLGYDVDRLLYNFRVNAGLPAPGKPYGGWEAPGCGLRGHFTGHYLSACALMYAATGDKEFKERSDQIVAGLAKCQEAQGDGYLSAFPTHEFDVLETKCFSGVWAPYYTIHKIMAGLIDAYEQTGNKQALSVATRMADYFDRRITKLDPQTIDKMTRTDYTGNPVNEFGGFACALLSLHRITGEQRYLDLARVFMREWFITPLAAGEDSLEKMHANTHIPQVTSFALAAEITGDKRLLDAARNFWQLVTQRHSFAFGGNAFDEKFKAPGVEAADLTDLSGETCNTYNMLKLTRVLFEQRPECALGDYYELALYNHILASIAPDMGCTMYHLSAKPGHFKVYGTPEESMWCCNGTGIENTARYNEGIYYTGSNSLWVNLYIPSTVELPSLGIRLKQETKFPADDRVAFTIGCGQPTDFSLLLRLPGWLAGSAGVSVNGKPLPAETIPAAGHYLKIQRSWKDGDQVELRLPMSLRVRPSMDDPKVVSFFYGPILLAGELGSSNMPASDLATKQNQFSTWPTVPPPDLVSTDPGSFRAVPDKPQAFTQATAAGSNGADTVRFIPFYQVHHERYSIYWRTPPDNN